MRVIASRIRSSSSTSKTVGWGEGMAGLLMAHHFIVRTRFTFGLSLARFESEIRDRENRLMILNRQETVKPLDEAIPAAREGFLVLSARLIRSSSQLPEFS